jgi:hypothetical protein
MTTYFDQLEQIFNGATQDDDLVSKSYRDQLIVDGLAQKHLGYNIITSDGVGAYLFPSNKGEDTLVNYSMIDLLARIASRRFAHTEEFDGPPGAFNIVCFSAVVGDLVGFPILSELAVRLILSERENFSVNMDGTRYLIEK